MVVLKEGNDNMNWFKRHLNWTYLFSIVFAFIVAFMIGVMSSSPAAETSDPLYGLQIYLDNSYTRTRSATVIPDLNNIPWSASDSNGWQTGTLIAYLENRGNSTLEVTVSATENPQYARPGFGVSSDTIVLNPNERSPIVMELSQSPMVLSSLSQDMGTETIYFQVNPTPPDESGTDLAIWITVIAIMMGSAGWVLHQKGRSYGWILLSLSGIGIIIILCLENKRLTSEVEVKQTL